MAARAKTLTERQFQALATKLKRLQEQTESTTLDTKLETYWSFGDLIEEQKLALDAGYHNSVLSDLSRETGISLRTLQQSLAFREAYESPPLGQELSWSHVRVLIRLSTSKQRKFYAALAKKNDWTSKELSAAISSDLYAGGTLESPRLVRPTQPAFLYQARDVRVIDGDTIEVLLDLGFHSFSQQRIRLAGLDAPETGNAKARAARNFLVEHLAAAQTITLKTHKADLHGRYVAHVFTSPTRVSIDDCFAVGTYVNDLLVRKHHARVVG